MPREDGPDYGPAVNPVTRELRYTSVSAIGRFDETEEGGCKRKWYQRYVLRIPEPKTKNQEKGTKAHLQIKHYLTTGEDVLGPHLRVGKHLLPAPGLDIAVEHELSQVARDPKNLNGPLLRLGHVFEADGLPLIGAVDWKHRRGTYIDPDGVLKVDPPATAEVGDNKTTSDLKWAKTAEKLATLTQMIGYAEDERLTVPGLRFIRLSHVTFLMGDKKQSVKRTTLIPVETISALWFKKGHSVVAEMRGVAKAQTLEELPMPEDIGVCAMFRGCHYKSNCFKSPLARFRVTLLAKVRAKSETVVNEAFAGNGAAAAATPAPAAAAPAVPAPPAAPRRGFTIQDQSTTPDRPAGSLAAKNAEQGKAYVLPSGVVGTYLAANGGKQYFLPVGGGAPIQLDDGDPVTLLGGGTPAPAAPAAAAVATPLPPATAAAVATPLPPVQTQAVAQTAVATTAPVSEDKPARRARITKPKVETAPAAAAATGAAPVLRIFVNCLPSGPFTSLDPILVDAVGTLEEQFQVPDIRLPTDSNHPLAFGRWKGALASQIRANLPPAGDYVAITHGSELMDVVVEALMLSGAQVQRTL